MIVCFVELFVFKEWISSNSVGAAHMEIDMTFLDLVFCHFSSNM